MITITIPHILCITIYAVLVTVTLCQVYKQILLINAIAQ